MHPKSFRRVLRVVTLTVTAGAVLALPAAAFACGGGSGVGGDDVVSAIAVLACGGGGGTGENVASAAAVLHVL